MSAGSRFSNAGTGKEVCGGVKTVIVACNLGESSGMVVEQQSENVPDASISVRTPLAVVDDVKKVHH